MKIPINLFHPDTNKKILFDNDKKKYYSDNLLFPNFNEIPNLFLEDGNSLTKIQSEFYNEVKFPNYDDTDNFGTLVEKAENSIFIKKLDNEIPFGANILEAGCGTGQLSIFLSRYMRNIFAIDLSEGSLIEANKFIMEHNISNVYLAKMNIFKLFFQKNFFDIVIANGVIHHTHNPELAFEKLVDVLKVDGIIVIGLYHKYGRMIQKIRQKLIAIFGDKFKFLDKRFRKNFSEKKKYAWFLDQYKNPHEITFSISEVLKWFKKNKIDYLSSLPIDFNPDDKLFKKKEIKVGFELFLKEFSQIFNLRQIYEGGFFVVIGKKLK
jgi:SAM-dependent methyltransferase